MNPLWIAYNFEARKPDPFRDGMNCELYHYGYIGVPQIHDSHRFIDNNVVYLYRITI